MSESMIQGGEAARRVTRAIGWQIVVIVLVSLMLAGCGRRETGNVNGVWTTYTLDSGLVGENITEILPTSDGSIWFGTTRGASRLDSRGRWHSYTRANGLPGESVYALAETKDGTLWFGTDNGAARMDKNGKWQDIVFDEESAWFNFRVWDIYVANDDTLWLGTSWGIGHLNADGSPADFPENGFMKTDDNIWATLESSDGSLWFASNKGLFQMLPGGEWGADHWELTWWWSIPSALKASDGSLYFGRNSSREMGNGGVSQLLADGTWNHYMTVDGLVSPSVRALAESSDGSIWIGTHDGISRLGPDGSMTTYTEADGLVNNTVYAIGEGQDGSIWFGTEAGLSRLTDPTWRPDLTTAQSTATAVVAAQATAQAEATATVERQATATAQAQATAIAPIVERTREEVLIPAGPFEMGCGPTNPDCGEDNQPLHTVTLDDYYIDVYEVTNARYRACIYAGNCTEPQNAAPYFDNAENYAHPVINVTWQQAADFCAWDGKRLPTEAEWEKAARGDRDTRTYPWGEEIPACDLANSLMICGIDHPLHRDLLNPVGSYPKGVSPYGLYDMAGNVEEWVADWYNKDYYRLSPSENPTGPRSGYRLLRGGSRRTFDEPTRTYYRNPVNPDYFDETGFRCARTP